MFSEDRLNALLAVCEDIAKRNLCPATAGNFSIRLDENTMKISSSGKDKSRLTANDFVTCDLNGKLRQGEGKPSDEAALHGMLYQLNPDIQCVLHTHSVPLTVLSMLPDTDNVITLQGYEMQKTIQGFQSHEDILKIIVMDNDQNMPRLAGQLKSAWSEIQKTFGFIVRGHGLYCWGYQISDAKRHMEGLEFLIECELRRKLYL